MAALDLEAQPLVMSPVISDGNSSPPAPKPFFKLESIPEQLTLQYSSFHTLYPERKGKIYFSIILTLSMIILFILHKLVPIQNKYHMFAYLLIILVLIWNVVFYSVILTAKHLHMIYVKRKQLNYSQLLFLPYGYVEDEHRVLLSVSAVNAIIGSNAERAALLTVYTTFGVTYCAVSSKWCEQSSISSGFTSLDLQLILNMISALGLLMIATWQMEPNRYSYAIHYLSAGITVISSPAALLMQQQFSAFSIVIVVIVYFGLVEWLILYSFIPATHKNLKLVHRYSMISIVNEAIVLMLSYGCGVVFIYNL